MSSAEFFNQHVQIFHINMFEAFQMSTNSICFHGEIKKNIHFWLKKCFISSNGLDYHSVIIYSYMYSCYSSFAGYEP